jgi:hypothetical protein
MGCLLTGLGAEFHVFRYDMKAGRIRVRTFVRFAIDLSDDSDSTAFMEQVMVFSYEYAIGDDRD